MHPCPSRLFAGNRHLKTCTRPPALTRASLHRPSLALASRSWADQLLDFCKTVIDDERGVLIVCNSVGSVAGLQAALDNAEAVRGVMLLDPSLRMLHVRRQNPLQVPLTSALQTLLRETPVGLAFFDAVAKPNAVRNVLKQAYGVDARVDDELIDVILTPGKAAGAARVFLDFISYSGGPLPEDLLARIDGTRTPVWIAWGEDDPWEPIAQGRAYADFDSVRKFIPLPGLGHCPQDEAPERINELVLEFSRELFANE
jgi:pimeloyl-ACP methyl ester carboxylesterase